MHAQTSAIVELKAIMATMTTRQQINLLLSVGIPASDVMGIPECVEHYTGRPLRETEGLTFDGQTVWCKGCHSWQTLRVQ